MLATSKVPKRVLPKLEKEIKMMLHASRDAMRTRYHANDNTVDTHAGIYHPNKTSFAASEGYQCEAFGILRAMYCAGWGDYGGPVNVDKVGNLRYWYDQLQKEVLAEENFGGFEDFDPNHTYIKGNGSGECDYCLERYGKDDAGRRK